VKVYLAGSSAPAERARIKCWKQRLEEAQITVVSTWIASVETYGGNPREATKEERRAWAHGCRVEIAQADIFWLLVPPVDAPTRGAWAELDYAQLWGCTLIASGDTKQSIFCAYALEFAEDKLAFDEILRLASAYRSAQRP
jgi:nucleoside 2-deoxyribosyltransferase